MTIEKEYRLNGRDEISIEKKPALREMLKKLGHKYRGMGLELVELPEFWVIVSEDPHDNIALTLCDKDALLEVARALIPNVILGSEFSLESGLEYWGKIGAVERIYRFRKTEEPRYSLLIQKKKNVRPLIECLIRLAERLPIEGGLINGLIVVDDEEYFHITSDDISLVLAFDLTFIESQLRELYPKISKN